MGNGTRANEGDAGDCQHLHMTEMNVDSNKFSISVSIVLKCLSNHTIYHRAGKKNYPKEIFIFSPQGIYFIPQFLSLVNDHTEPMTTITAWIKKKFPLHCKGTELDEFLLVSKCFWL